MNSKFNNLSKADCLIIQNKPELAALFYFGDLTEQKDADLKYYDAKTNSSIDIGKIS